MQRGKVLQLTSTNIKIPFHSTHLVLTSLSSLFVSSFFMEAFLSLLLSELPSYESSSSYADCNIKPTIAQILVASSVGFIIAAADIFGKSSFIHRVILQRGNWGSFARDLDGDSLFIKLVEEFERCILSYFAFHWSFAEISLAQVLQGTEVHEPKKKLKDMVLAATREQRFERVTKNLKVARLFNTLVEEMKAIGLAAQQIDDSECTDVMAPVAHKDRSPVLLLMGGGMGAGKSTVLKDIIKEPFWAEASGNAVIIEADAFKESDVIYRALSSRCHHDMVHTAELVKSLHRFLSSFPTMHDRPYSSSTMDIKYHNFMSRGIILHCIVDPEEIKCLKMVADLNEEAESVNELYQRPSPSHQSGSVWKDIVLSPSRKNVQLELKYAIQRVERLK